MAAKFPDNEENEEREESLATVVAVPTSLRKYLARLCLERMVANTSSAHSQEEEEVFKGVPKPSVKLCELPKIRLSRRELKLPPFEREMRITLKKCNLRKKYDIISGKEFKEWFNKAKNIEKNNIKRVYGNELVKVVSGEGPHKFNIIMQHCIDLYELFHTWLHEAATDGLLEDVHKQDLISLRGECVLVHVTDEDYSWYRAIVTECFCGDTVNVHLPDRGGEIFNVSLDKLKRLPKSFITLPHLASLARMVDFECDDNAWDGDNHINQKCLEVLRTAEDLYVNRVGYDVSTNCHIVKVWTMDKNRERDITSEIKKSIVAWQNDPYSGLMGPEQNKLCFDGKSPVIYREWERCSISYIVNPFEFYVLRKYNDEQKLLEERMQSFYNGIKGTERYTIRSPGVIEGYIYVVEDTLFSESDFPTFHRVRVLKATLEEKYARVFYIDVGIEKDVKLSLMRKITGEFFSINALAVQCSLSNVSPMGDSGEWSDVVIRYFMKILHEFKTKLLIVPLKYTYADCCKQYQKRNIRVEVVVLLTRDDDYNNSTVQFELCRLNMANPNGITCGNVLTLDQYQPSSSYIEKLHNIIRSSRARNWKASLELYNWHPNYDDESATELKHLPSRIRKSLCWVRILEVSGPDSIFVQLQQRLPFLFHLMEMLEEDVRSGNEVPLEQRRIGLLVAVNLRRDQSDCEDDGVFRAIVIRCPPDGLITVFLVDFVKKVDIEWNCCRVLPCRYEEIPCFAHRLHLDVENLIPSTIDGQWSKANKSNFKLYLEKYQMEFPIYYVWRNEKSIAVPLSCFKQSVSYSKYCKQWLSCVPIPGPQCCDCSVLDGLRHSVILNNLFVSIGAVIMYENFTELQKPYEFVSIYNDLVTK